jgi:hypothetical protein
MTTKTQTRRDANAENAIKAVVNREMAGRPLERIIVTPRENHSGEPALYVLVVVASDKDVPPEPDQNRLVGQMIDELEQIDDTRFPYLHFGYDSVFQRLSSLCASRLSGQEPGSEEYLRLYRALEHKQVRAALNKSVYKAELGARFDRLQDARHWADYSIAPHPEPDLSSAGREFSPGEAQAYVDMARDALQFIDSLDPSFQLKLAILLIVRDR